MRIFHENNLLSQTKVPVTFYMYVVFLKYLGKCLLCLWSIGPCWVSWFDPLFESCFPFWPWYLAGSGGEVLFFSWRPIRLLASLWTLKPNGDSEDYYESTWSSAHEGRSHLSQYISTASWISTGSPPFSPPPPPFILSHLGEDTLLLNGLWEEELNSNQLFGKATNDRGDLDHRRSYDSQMI